MTIAVQGERYESVADLQATIEELTGKLDGMPSDTPEHSQLAAHIERLRAAAAESGGGADVERPDTPDESPDESPDEEADEEEVSAVTSLQVAAETGAPIVCPLCGQEVPFPEAPPLDPYSERCTDCDGWGKVLTGSRVDGWVWRDCKGCDGNGLREKTTTTHEPLTPLTAPTPEAPGAVWNPERQNWDPPTGAQPPWTGAVWDPFYGKWS